MVAVDKDHDIIEFCEKQLMRKLTWMEAEMILKLYNGDKKRLTDIDRLVRLYKKEERKNAKIQNLECDGS